MTLRSRSTNFDVDVTAERATEKCKKASSFTDVVQRSQCSFLLQVAECLWSVLTGEAELGEEQCATFKI